MAFNVQENAVFIPQIFKNLPTVENPPPTPSPRLVASLPRFGPPVEKSWLRQCGQVVIKNLYMWHPELGIILLQETLMWASFF